jgi:flavin-dependent dehydrogenase
MLRMPNQLREPAGDGWALVGDAGYHRDAITGHGISDAFRDAELLAAALDRALRDPRRGAEALASYGVERNRMLRELLDITCELGGFPAEARFTELLRDLARAIDDQAGELARRPLPAWLATAV